MFKQPSRQRQRRHKVAINLVPIMDGVFIVVFFLLITASSERSFKIQTDLPVVSNRPPEPKEKDTPPPLALALDIKEQELTLTSGHRTSNQKTLLTIKRNTEGAFELEKLHQTLVELKAKHPEEQMIIFQVAPLVSYEEIVSLMDVVRELRSTDQEVYFKDDKGKEKKAEALFPEVIFGNLLS